MFWETGTGAWTSMSSIPKLYSSPDSTHSGYSSFSNLPIKSEHFDYSNTIFYFICMSGCFVCICLCSAWRDQKKTLDPIRTKVKDSYQVPCGCQKSTIALNHWAVSPTHVKLSEWLPTSYWNDEGVCVLIHMLANSEKFTLKWSIIHLILGMKMC